VPDQPRTDLSDGLPGPEGASRPRGALANEAAEFAVQLGAALVACGAPVDYVERILVDVSRRYDVDFGYSVLPTGLIALGHDGSSTVASIAATDPASYRFDQISALFAIVDDALDGTVSATDGIARLGDIDRLRPRFGPVATVAAHVVLTVGLAMLMKASWLSLALVSGLGLWIGLLRLVAVRHPTFNRLLPAIGAFTVALAAVVVERNVQHTEGLNLLVPPLVTFLPGAMLTVGAVELTSGSIVAGSSRLIAGVLQLFLLSFGIVAALGIINPPHAESLIDVDPVLIGRWAPWVGVLLFGLGAAVHFSAAVSSYPALVTVLYAAFASQLFTNQLIGTYFAGFVGAIVAVLASAVLRRHAHGPPVFVTFLPAFWLLVPGALSLIGVASFAVGAPSDDVGTALFTILAVALGVVAGLSAVRKLEARQWW
jgi:uncharacterized membrane protein YjjP (DUF1212 family)